MGHCVGRRPLAAVVRAGRAGGGLGPDERAAAWRRLGGTLAPGANGLRWRARARDAQDIIGQLGRPDRLLEPAHKWSHWWRRTSWTSPVSGRLVVHVGPKSHLTLCANQIRWERLGRDDENGHLLELNGRCGSPTPMLF